MIAQTLFVIATIALFSTGHWIGALICLFFVISLEFQS